MKIYKIDDEQVEQKPTKSLSKKTTLQPKRSTKLSPQDRYKMQKLHREKLARKQKTEKDLRANLANGNLANEKFIITKIAPAVKTPGRYNVFVNDDFSFSLDEVQLVESHLKKGQVLGSEQYLALKNDSDFGKNYVRALDLISRRPRSAKEIRDYAFRKQWSPENRDKVIARLCDRGYLDDEKFAKMFVTSRAQLRNFSWRKMEMELMKKGIAPDIRAKVLNENDDFDEENSLRKLVSKKFNHYDNDQKLITYLARQGFSYDKIKIAINEFRATNDEEKK